MKSFTECFMQNLTAAEEKELLLRF